ncbi:unnamed protein product, partial [Brenthis ino]
MVASGSPPAFTHQSSDRAHVCFEYFELFNMNENKEFWESFISIYKRHTCLWKVKSKEYMNSDLRNVAYSELIEKAKEIHDNVDLAFVKKKIESMRNCFRRELRKVKQSLKTGSSADSVYKPFLWYFDLLLFTSDQEEARHGTSSIASPLSTTEDSVDDTIVNSSHVDRVREEVAVGDGACVRGVDVVWVGHHSCLWWTRCLWWLAPQGYSHLQWLAPQGYSHLQWLACYRGSGVVDGSTNARALTTLAS